MQYFFKCAVFLVLIGITYCWNDYTDLYEDLQITQITTHIGSQVTLVCKDDIELELVEWIHNDYIFFPGESDLNLINIDWVDGSNINLTINTEVDGGKWECRNYGFPVTRYQIEVKPAINTSILNIPKLTSSITTEGSYHSGSTANFYTKTNETSKKVALTSSIASSNSVNGLLSDSNVTAISPDQHNNFVEEIKIVPLYNTLHKTTSNKVPEGEAKILGAELVKTAYVSLKNPYLKTQSNTGFALVNTPYMILFSLSFLIC